MPNIIESGNFDMARQYSHKQFFRHVPNAQLGHYFHAKRNVLKEIAFGQLKKKEIYSD